MQAEAYVVDSTGFLLATFEHYSVKRPAELSNLGEIHSNILPELMPKRVKETLNANQRKGHYPEGYSVVKFSYQPFTEALSDKKSSFYATDVQFKAWSNFMATFDKHRISTTLYLVVSEWT